MTHVGSERVKVDERGSGPGMGKPKYIKRYTSPLRVQNAIVFRSIRNQQSFPRPGNVLTVIRPSTISNLDRDGVICGVAVDIGLGW